MKKITTTYYSNSEKIYEIYETYNSMKHGKYTSFFRNGIPKIDCYYQNNSLIGLCVEYHSSGNVWFMAYYVDGVCVDYIYLPDVPSEITFEKRMKFMQKVNKMQRGLDSFFGAFLEEEEDERYEEVVLRAKGELAPSN